MDETFRDWLDSAWEIEVPEVKEGLAVLDAQELTPGVATDVETAFFGALLEVGRVAFLLGLRVANDPTWLMFGEVKGEAHTGINAAVRNVVQSRMKGTN